MKSWLIAGMLVLLTAMSATAQKRDFTLEKLISISLLPEAGLQGALAKKGFRRSSDTAIYFEKRNKVRELEGTYRLQLTPDKNIIEYSSTNVTDLQQLANDLKREGFYFVEDRTLLPGIYELYQKGAWTVTPSTERDSSLTWYRLTMEFKKLPSYQSFQYLEDLMQLNSHEYLAAVFGPAQVRRDVFYFSEKELSKCSILFPNTAKQVIVVWKDEVYNRGIELLVLGAQTQGGSAATSFLRAADQNQWRSQQGVAVGMPLRQLQDANGEPFEFYGWETEEPGVVARHNKGKIDFKNLGVQLHCLDCNEDRYYSNSSLLNSAVLLQHSRRVYVTTIVLKAE